MIDRFLNTAISELERLSGIPSREEVLEAVAVECWRTRGRIAEEIREARALHGGLQHPTMLLRMIIQTHLATLLSKDEIQQISIRDLSIADRNASDDARLVCPSSCVAEDIENLFMPNVAYRKNKYPRGGRKLRTARVQVPTRLQPAFT